jgi:hypothetical protein
LSTYPYTAAHNLGTTKLIVQSYDDAHNMVQLDVNIPDANHVVLSSDIQVPNAITLIVMGVP